MKYLYRILAWCASPMGLFVAAGWAASLALNLLVEGSLWSLPAITMMVVCYYIGMLRLRDLIALNTAYNIDLAIQQYNLHLKSLEHSDSECRDVPSA